MNFMTRRNAVIGYLALQALKRSRRNAAVGYLAAQGMEHTRARRRNRRAVKVAFYALLGVASLGALAAAAGFASKRKARATAAPSESSAVDESAVEPVPGDAVQAEAEPVATT